MKHDRTGTDMNRNRTTPMQILSTRNALIVLLSCLPVLSATSQTRQDEFGAAVMAAPDGIHVLIARDVLHPSTAGSTNGWIGYNIYRKAAGENDFRKINGAPVSRVGTLAEFEKRAGVMVDFLASMVKAKDHQELWQMIEKNDPHATTLAMFDPTLREALGLLWRDTNVKSGTTYAYEITRVSRDGKESDRSTPSTATMGRPRFVMKGPIAVTLTADEHTAELTWKPNPADTGAFGYTVYRSLDPKGRFLALNDRPIVLMANEKSKEPPTGRFVDSTVAPGRAYYYAVVSRDYVGNESPKEPVYEVEPRDTTPPLIPQAVIARPSGLGIAVSWAHVTSEDLIGYHVYRATHSDGPYERITETIVPPDSGIFEDKSAKPNVQYFYRVTAVDAAGNESKQSARGLTTYENFKPPMPPQGVIAEAAKGGIMIRWKANDEEDLQGYFVYRAESLNGELVQTSPLVRKDTTFYLDADKHISPKGAYWYVVQAVNLSGAQSPFSAPVISSPDAATGPDAPMSFRGYQDEIGNHLFWSAPSDNIASGFNVYRAVEAKSLRWEKINDVPLASDEFSYIDRTAAVGTSYAYRIRCVTDKGVEGTPSHTVLLSRFTPPPAAPADLIVVSTPSGATLQWTPSREPGVKGYNIWRKIGRERWRKLNGDVLATNVASFNDLSAKKGVISLYAISTVATDGRESEQSDPVMVRLK